MPTRPHDKPCNVLHVILSLEIGGMEQVVADLVRSLDQQRFIPIIACIDTLGPIADELKAQGIRIIKVPPMASKVSFLYPAPLIRVIRESGAEIIHVHSGCWYKAAIAARMAGVKNIIYTEHGRTFPDSPAIIFMDRIFSLLTTRVVAVSSELARYLRDVVRINDDKISVILNGVDLSKFPLPCADRTYGPVRIGVIARLAPVKDIPTLLRAMKIVAGKHPDTVLEITGDGPESERLQQLAVDLGISSVVRFLGFRRDIPEILGGLDIFALSSLSEGTSVTILEAMAAGKPVVATKVGGNPSLIEDGVNGYLVPAGKPDELASALTVLVVDEQLRRSIGAANRNKVDMEYSLQAMVKGYEGIYT